MAVEGRTVYLRERAEVGKSKTTNDRHQLGAGADASWGTKNENEKWQIRPQEKKKAVNSIFQTRGVIVTPRFRAPPAFHSATRVE